MSLSLDARYDQPERQRAFYRNLIDALSALPGVQAAGAITNLPLAHGETLSWLTVEGHSFDEKVFFQTRCATPRYFAAMGIRLLKGRFFTDEDAVGRQLVAIVNRTFAKEYFPGQSALGSASISGMAHLSLLSGPLLALWTTYATPAWKRNHNGRHTCRSGSRAIRPPLSSSVPTTTPK